METVKEIILNSKEIDRKISRMAYEIYESNFKEQALVIAGINGQGYILAGLLANQLMAISSIQADLMEINLDKNKPHLSKVELSGKKEEVIGKSVIVVDDVLNTGRTLIYSLRPFLDMKVKKIEIAVLVDRSHIKFPVKSNFKGLSLSTTLNDHVIVSLNEEKEVYLI
ncbi:MAG: phosphoribosyltransferase family protein [Cyclobacteriaceae bacterium]|nr:phosphoribosyltransferase family protein [Cyclobacteriaceae bacterium]